MDQSGYISAQTGTSTPLPQECEIQQYLKLLTEFLIRCCEILAQVFWAACLKYMRTTYNPAYFNKDFKKAWGDTIFIYFLLITGSVTADSDRLTWLIMLQERATTINTATQSSTDSWADTSSSFCRIKPPTQNKLFAPRWKMSLLLVMVRDLFHYNFYKCLSYFWIFYVYRGNTPQNKWWKCDVKSVGCMKYAGE